MRKLFVFLCFSILCLFSGKIKAAENRLSQPDFSLANHKYVICDTCNLEGGIIRIPEHCTISFEGVGCIKNGTILFNGTNIHRPKFLDCKYGGDIQIEGSVIDSLFCRGTDYDQDVLWWLIEQTANNGTTLELTKDYAICSSRIYSEPYKQRERSYVVLKDKSFTIKGNKHTIYDRHEHKGHFNKDFLVLVGCHQVLIESLYFEGLHNEINSIATLGQNQIPAPGGTNVILCVGDTDGIRVVDGRCRHCYSYIWCGCDPQVSMDAQNRCYYNDNLVVKGFENVDVEVDAYDTQYPVAVFKGRNVKVRLHFLYARRGCRLQGVDDADVKIEGAFATTPVMLLLKDAISYADHSFTNRVYNACSNINAEIERIAAVDSITNYKWWDIALNIGSYDGQDSLATAREFNGRQTPYQFKNIKVKYNCNAQQYAVLFTPRRKLSLQDEYEIVLHHCMGGGLTDSGLANEHSKLKLNLTKCNVDRISMSFNDSDEIAINASTVRSFQNKKQSHPQIKAKRSKVTYKN